jgi:hypothetical protein
MTDLDLGKEYRIPWPRLRGSHAMTRGDRRKSGTRIVLLDRCSANRIGETLRR